MHFDLEVEMPRSAEGLCRVYFSCNICNPLVVWVLQRWSECTSVVYDVHFRIHCDDTRVSNVDSVGNL